MGCAGLGSKGHFWGMSLGGGEQPAVAFLHETTKWWTWEGDEAAAASISRSLSASCSQQGMLHVSQALGLPWGGVGPAVSSTAPMQCRLSGRWVHLDVTALALLLSHGFWFHCFTHVHHFLWPRAAQSGICMWSLCGCPLAARVQSPVALCREGQLCYLKLPEVEYTCRVHHVFRIPYSKCSITCDSFGFLLKAGICFDLQVCFLLFVAVASWGSYLVPSTEQACGSSASITVFRGQEGCWGCMLVAAELVLRCSNSGAGLILVWYPFQLGILGTSC